MISNKGRVERLKNWTSKERKNFLKEQILSQFMIRNSYTTKHDSLVSITAKEKNQRITLVRNQFLIGI